MDKDRTIFLTGATGLPGSGIENFKKTIDICSVLLGKAGRECFSSPYSAIPLVSQILGLNTPLTAGDSSPYAIKPLGLPLQENMPLMKELSGIPDVEKREIVDEIYQMIAPLLLNEEDSYIKLLINTKYNTRLRKLGNKKLKEFRKILRDKFQILKPFVEGFLDRKGGDFGFIAHFGYKEDLHQEFSFLKGLPSYLEEKWSRYSYPVIIEILLKNFPASDNGTKKDIKGWVVFVSNCTKELLEDSRLRKKKILQAALLSEKLGAKIIGMGGLVASFLQGGYWLAEEIPQAGFTTGHAYTIGNIIEIVENCAEKTGLDIKKAAVAIVGAGGSIGSGCAKLLARKNPDRLILIELSTFSSMQKLEELKNTVKRINPEAVIDLSVNITDVKKADLIIVATNSPTSVIKSEYLKPGAIVIDDSFPKNVPREILRQRDDVILLEGGMVQVPSSVELYLPRAMPKAADLSLIGAANRKETFGCFAEVLVLALYGYTKNYGLGYSDPKLAEDIMQRAKKVNFHSAPLQFFNELLSENRLKKVAQIIRKARE